MKSLTLIRGVALTGALTLSHPVVALATSGGENTPLVGVRSTVAHASGGASSSLVRTIVGLFVVIVVIYGISWMLRQHKGAKDRATGSGLAPVATLPLGTGRSVALVRVGRELHLLGVAENGVTAIRSYTEKEALASGLELVEPDQLAELDGVMPPLVRVVDAVRRMTERA
jgi:flagellar protein FliO/FliZ